MLEQLTPEQEAMLPSFVEYALRIGLRTDRRYRPAAGSAIKAHWIACGLKAPEVVWHESPFAACYAISSAGIENHVRAIVRDAILNKVEGITWVGFWISVRDMIWSRVRDPVRASAWSSLKDGVRDNVRLIVGEHVRDHVKFSIGAHYDADSAAWLLAWRTYGANLPASALTFIKMTELCWWLYPSQDVVHVSEPPIRIERNDTGRLHSEASKIIEFADGAGLSFWRGLAWPT